MSLFQKTVGVVGMGNIGKIVAKKWIGAFECSIIGYDPVAPKDAWADIPHVRVHSLDDLVEKADVITLHVPLLDSTRGLIGGKEFGLMKKNAILVNCARGGVVDEPALLVALKEKKIWGAVLDAMEVEPPTLEAYEDFLAYDNIIMTPHVGASTIENQSRSGLAVVDILLQVLDGKDGVVGK
jgi:D-3-phosphoglycerate dehydrogenase